MPNGYLVQLGDGRLDPGDSIVGPLVTFTTDIVVGEGDWVWSGTFGGQTYTNTSEPGTYELAQDGNIYFVPAFGPVDTLTSATATETPTVVDGSGSAESLEGTAIGDLINAFGGSDQIDAFEGDDIINAGGGGDTVLGGGGDDDINAGGGADFVNAGDGDDEVDGRNGDDDLYGGAGNDDLDGGFGADLLVGGSGDDILSGGDQDDVLYGDQDPNASINESLVWSDIGGNFTDVRGGFTETTGGVDVTVSVTDDGALTSARIDTDDDQYRETGETFGQNSALELVGDGGSDVTTVRFEFASSDDGDTEDTVENVTFRINDVDVGGWTDVLTVNAFDASGNPVAVTLTPEGGDNTTSGNTVTAGEANGAADDASGSVLVEIDGPVAAFEVIYENDGSDGQRAWITDVNYDTRPITVGGDDTMDGGLGADDLFGGAGDDNIFVSAGDDAFGEDGDDTFTLTDLGEGPANIFIDGGEDGEDGGGDTIDLNGLAGPGAVTFDPGDSEAGTITLLDGSVVTFSNIENIICFTPGAMIETPFGARPVETLQVGDLVLTRDHGPQPIRWVGARTVAGRGDFAPIEITRAAFPEATSPLFVSPQHRMLFTGYRAELLFGESEVLVAAKHLVDDRAVRITPCPAVTYIHLMFDRHEIITASGIATESFFAADQSLAALESGPRDELLALFPDLRCASLGPTARRTLKSYEAALL
ncbi:MAG: Hint domain-containing protein [Pseudomonadota bacterium]